MFHKGNAVRCHIKTHLADQPAWIAVARIKQVWWQGFELQQVNVAKPGQAQVTWGQSRCDGQGFGPLGPQYILQTASFTHDDRYAQTFQIHLLKMFKTRGPWAPTLC